MEVQILKGFDLAQTVRKSRSVRSYEKRPLSQEDKECLLSDIDELCSEESPFPAKIHIQLLEAKPGTDTEKLGTYGVIRGAKTFLGVTAENTETAPEAVGFTFEKLVLAATAMGLGTCWIAGTFNREQFAGAMDIGKDEIFPIVCPIGYPLTKKTLIDSVFRRMGKSDRRKPWGELFFENEFGNPLSEAQAGEYAFALEMLRLAPSAMNRQPWRVVHAGSAFHFYREGNLTSKYAFDLPRLDAGIGACHFYLAARQHALAGEFKRLAETGIAAPEDMKYLFSWVTL